jgi:hypothetical protein
LRPIVLSDFLNEGAVASRTRFPLERTRATVGRDMSHGALRLFIDGLGNSPVGGIAAGARPRGDPNAL